MRLLAQLEEGRPKSQAASWMAAVAVQRLWRGLKGRRALGQVGGRVSAGRGKRGAHLSDLQLAFPEL